MDYSEYGGSVLLGLDGTVVKAHGSSNAKAFYSAIRQAKIAGEENIVQTMRETVGGKMSKTAIIFPGQGAQKLEWQVTYIMKKHVQLNLKSSTRST